MEMTPVPYTVDTAVQKNNDGDIIAIEATFCVGGRAYVLAGTFPMPQEEAPRRGSGA